MEEEDLKVQETKKDFQTQLNTTFKRKYHDETLNSIVDAVFGKVHEDVVPRNIESESEIRTTAAEVFENDWTTGLMKKIVELGRKQDTDVGGDDEKTVEGVIKKEVTDNIMLAITKKKGLLEKWIKTVPGLQWNKNDIMNAAKKALGEIDEPIKSITVNIKNLIQKERKNAAKYVSATADKFFEDKSKFSNGLNAKSDSFKVRITPKDITSDIFPDRSYEFTVTTKVHVMEVTGHGEPKVVEFQEKYYQSDNGVSLRRQNTDGLDEDHPLVATDVYSGYTPEICISSGDTTFVMYKEESSGVWKIWPATTRENNGGMHQSKSCSEKGGTDGVEVSVEYCDTDEDNFDTPFCPPRRRLGHPSDDKTIASPATRLL